VKGVTLPFIVASPTTHNFNPHTREGCDPKLFGSIKDFLYAENLNEYSYV